MRILAHWQTVYSFQMASTLSARSRHSAIGKLDAPCSEESEGQPCPMASNSSCTYTDEKPATLTYDPPAFTVHSPTRQSDSPQNVDATSPRRFTSTLPPHDQRQSLDNRPTDRQPTRGRLPRQLNSHVDLGLVRVLSGEPVSGQGSIILGFSG